MLNFESIGSPVAKIMDKTAKNKEQILYLSDPELDGDVRNGYSNIKYETITCRRFPSVETTHPRGRLVIFGVTRAHAHNLTANLVSR